VRTSSRALARLVELTMAAVDKAGSAVDIAVHHLDSQSRADDLAARLTSRLGPRDGGVEVHVVELGAVVGAHVGPGTIAVAVSPRPGP
jgi:fatty acid-binding protein DegV